MDGQNTPVSQSGKKHKYPGYIYSAASTHEERCFFRADTDGDEDAIVEVLCTDGRLVVLRGDDVELYWILEISDDVIADNLFTRMLHVIFWLGGGFIFFLHQAAALMIFLPIESVFLRLCASGSGAFILVTLELRLCWQFLTVVMSFLRLCYFVITGCSRKGRTFSSYHKLFVELSKARCRSRARIAACMGRVFR